jgi:hypothetical protein
VKGKRVTGFTNGEEEAVQLTHVVPFLVEDELKRVGGLYEKAPERQSYAVVDGRLVTGQNPASSTAAARRLSTRLHRFLPRPALLKRRFNGRYSLPRPGRGCIALAGAVPNAQYALQNAFVAFPGTEIWPQSRAHIFQP